MIADSTPVFVRTRATWFSYAFLAFFGLAISLIGPIMPFLGAKLNLTFTEISYHFTVSSVGIIVISLIADRIVARVGSDRMVWAAAVMVGVGLLGVAFGGTLPVTIASMFVFGCAIGTVFMVANTAISVAAGPHAAKAYSEANIIAGLPMIAGPVLAGMIARSPLGWQAIPLIPLVVIGLYRMMFGGLAIPTPPAVPLESRALARRARVQPLPSVFWFFAVLAFLSIGIENLVSGLGATYFSTVVKLDPSASASVMSVFAVAIVLGRVIGRRLLDVMPDHRVLLLAFVWVLLTFPLYWLGTHPALNITGPLSVSRGMQVVGAAVNRASARFGMVASLSVISTVQVFGGLSDAFGMRSAYTLLMVLSVVAIALASTTGRFRRAPA